MSAQGRDTSDLIFNKGGESVSEVADKVGREVADKVEREVASEELEKPLGESIIQEDVKECLVEGDGEKDQADRKFPSEPDASEANSSSREVPIYEKEQIGAIPNGADVSAVEVKVQKNGKTEEDTACRERSLHGERSELAQLAEPDVDGGDTNQKRHLTTERRGEAERINQLYRNSKSTNINIYRRMYQSYLLLRKEQNELLIQNRKKEEKNMKLKYELDSLRGNSYYSNFFFNNDSDNLFEELASGISNIWKWMDMESKNTNMRSGQKGNVAPTVVVSHTQGVVPPREGDPERNAHLTVEGISDDRHLLGDSTPGKVPDGGKSPQGGNPQVVHKQEYASTQNEVPTEGSAEDGTSFGRGAFLSEDRPDEHSEGYKRKHDAPLNIVQPNEVQPNGGRYPMGNEHRTDANTEVGMESSSYINEKGESQTMEGRIPPHGRDTQEATTHNGDQKGKVVFVKRGYKHLDMNEGREVNNPPFKNSFQKDDRVEKKNSFLWEKESRSVKRGDVKYGRLHTRYTGHERSSARVDRERGAFTAMECPKDNIVDYIKGRLSSGGRISGKVALPGGLNSTIGTHSNCIKPNDYGNKVTIKEGDKFLYHICNCKENKYVPLNVGSFFMVPPRRTIPDEDFSLGSLQKCIGFILRRKEGCSHREVRVRHRKCNNVPADAVPLANAAPNVRALNGQKDPSPVGRSNGEGAEKKTRLATKEVVLGGDKKEGLEEREEKQVLKKGKSRRKRILKVDKNGNLNEGGTILTPQLKGQKEIEYNTQKMYMGLSRKFCHIRRRKGSMQRRNLFGRLNFKVDPNKEEKEPDNFFRIVKVKTARLAPLAEGYPRHVRFVRIGRRVFSLRGNRRADDGVEEVSEGAKKGNDEKNKWSELSPNLSGNCSRDGREDNVVEGDIPEGHGTIPEMNAISEERYSSSVGSPLDTTSHGFLQCEKDSVANSDLLMDALAKHVQYLDLSTKRIDYLEEENKDAVTIIGIQIKVEDGHIYLHLDALSTVEDSVSVWMKKNEKLLNSYVGRSQVIQSTLEYYCVDMFTFVSFFLNALENHVDEFPFYLSLTLDDIFRVHRGICAG